MSKQPITYIYAIFHLNLAFSSLEKSQHSNVVKKCYWPLLKIVQDEGIPLGLEMTAYTLECIAEVDIKWINTFKELLKLGRCELIASGDSQVIAPLVPSIVNHHNLRLGKVAYKNWLEITPTIAYVNEQAVSAGVLDCYIDEGFEAVVIEWDNPYSHNKDWPSTLLNRPQTLKGTSGREIKVIWNHAIAFQKLQRYAHNETILEDYLLYLNKVITSECKAFPLYGSDAEVFDYRPGRYQTEAKNTLDEWLRIKDLLVALAINNKYVMVRPCDVLSTWSHSEPLEFQTADHPISVKKQAKYNITRWALSGRNDIYLNTLCFQRLNELKAGEDVNDESWKLLCRLWASDYRTHLTEQRYSELVKEFPKINSRIQKDNQIVNEAGASKISYTLQEDKERHKLIIITDFIELTLNGKRGLNIEQLAFKSQKFIPVIGILSHGYFDHISYGVDFFSNHLVMERFRERDRITDLSFVSWNVKEIDNALLIECYINTAQGIIRKWYKIIEEKLQCGYEFENKIRPEASVRLAYMTLLNCTERSWYATHNGGSLLEWFESKDDFDHGAPVTSIVSANSALGATEGKIFFGSGENGIELTWSPAFCAALPMASSKSISELFLNRLWFSLVESDETLRQGGIMLDFSYTIRPCHKSQIIECI